MAHKANDLSVVSNKIERFISNYVSRSAAEGIIVGLSGGLDSSVVLKLAVNAIGSSRVHGLIMPSSATPEADTTDAIDLAKMLRIKHEIIDIQPIIESYAKVLPDNERARGNLAARIRMNILYYHASLGSYIVAGTSDKSERLLGYFTKFGDGAADILPLADLYKTEVRRLASFLKIPAAIVEKKSSPRLWKDHLAEDEIGYSYDQLDPILQLIEKKKMPMAVARKLDISLDDVKRIKEMVDKSAHKRKPAPFAKL
ncbi:MAG TPA: NAD+ synthase [Nitrososphaera sp.]|nr:NAD+ synthase [Nitrososphaera sp.]